MAQENWETIVFSAKWQSCSPAQPELFHTMFGVCLEVSTAQGPFLLAPVV